MIFFKLIILQKQLLLQLSLYCMIALNVYTMKGEEILTLTNQTTNKETQDNNIVMKNTVCFQSTTNMLMVKYLKTKLQKISF